MLMNRIRTIRSDDGYTMIAVIGLMVMVTTLVTGALAATNSDLNLVSRDLDRKRAYEAAQAGIADYSFRLNNDNAYWARCASVPAPTAVNLAGSTANRRQVPGDPEATYAIELIPATGQSQCNTSNPAQTMLEGPGPNEGTFRIRSTGYVGETKQAIVASYKRSSLLDFIYYTQLETSDPVTYGAPGSTIVNGAYQQCTLYEREGRYSQPIPGTNEYCNRIYFINGEHINGPLHTNDQLNICGDPEFGRDINDSIEVSAGPPGWTSNCGSGGSPIFTGPLETNAPVLTPPPTNGALEQVAGSNVTTGTTIIVLNGNNISGTLPNGLPFGPVAIPSEGVFYVKNGACSNAYTPFTATYPFPSGCGNVLVSGTYSGRLTIAAENDIIIRGNITRTGNGMLGLIANNFVRIWHPYPNETLSSCNSSTGSAGNTNLRVDAAILAIQHSFIVDHYRCGNPLGTLEVNGAIAQRFRGPVGTFSGSGPVSGYSKDYTYDDRLRYQEPPHFLNPVQSAWNNQRQTLDFGN